MFVYITVCLSLCVHGCASISRLSVYVCMLACVCLCVHACLCVCMCVCVFPLTEYLCMFLITKYLFMYTLSVNLCMFLVTKYLCVFLVTANTCACSYHYILVYKVPVHDPVDQVPVYVLNQYGTCVPSILVCTWLLRVPVYVPVD